MKVGYRDTIGLCLLFIILISGVKSHAGDTAIPSGSCTNNSVIDASNYNYVIEWTFRDDGTILGRAGSTGPELLGSMVIILKDLV